MNPAVQNTDLVFPIWNLLLKFCNLTTAQLIYPSRSGDLSNIITNSWFIISMAKRFSCNNYTPNLVICNNCSQQPIFNCLNLLVWLDDESFTYHIDPHKNQLISRILEPVGPMSWYLHFWSTVDLVGHLVANYCVHPRLKISPSLWSILQISSLVNLVIGSWQFL